MFTLIGLAAAGFTKNGKVTLDPARVDDRYVLRQWEPNLTTWRYMALPQDQLTGVLVEGSALS